MLLAALIIALLAVVLGFSVSKILFALLIVALVLFLLDLRAGGSRY